MGDRPEDWGPKLPHAGVEHLHREVAPAQGRFIDGMLHVQMVHVAPVSSYMMVMTISGTWRDPSPVGHEIRNPVRTVTNRATQDHTRLHQTGSPKDFPDVRFRGWEVLKDEKEYKYNKIAVVESVPCSEHMKSLRIMQGLVQDFLLKQGHMQCVHVCV